jgi:hypothetical protein
MTQRRASLVSACGATTTELRASRWRSSSIRCRRPALPSGPRGARSWASTSRDGSHRSSAETSRWTPRRAACRAGC